MAQDVEVVRLAPAEVDDQALAEIRRLAPYARSAGPAIGLETLLSLVMSGRSVVARRPCGQSPEIIGFAIAAASDNQALRRVVAVDPQLAGSELARRLGSALRAHRRPIFLFRPGRRPPLGLSASLN